MTPIIKIKDYCHKGIEFSDNETIFFDIIINFVYIQKLK